MFYVSFISVVRTLQDVPDSHSSSSTDCKLGHVCQRSDNVHGTIGVDLVRGLGDEVGALAPKIFFAVPSKM